MLHSTLTAVQDTIVSSLRKLTTSSVMMAVYYYIYHMFRSSEGGVNIFKMTILNADYHMKDNHHSKDDFILISAIKAEGHNNGSGKLS